MEEKYLIGKVRYKFTRETPYGPCTDLYVSVLKSTEPSVKGLVKCVCYRSHAKPAAERSNKLLVMVWFDEFKDAKHKGQNIKKVRATQVTPCSWKEFTVLSTNENGQFDPRA